MAQRQVPGTVLVPVLLVLLLHAPCRGQALYHTSSEVLHWFSHSAAKYPSLMRFRELKEHHTRTVLPVATITHGADAPHRSHRKPVVLFVFGEHARELITSEVGIWLARMLVDNTSAVYDWPELAAALERAGNNSSSSSGSSSSRDWASTARSWVQDLLSKLEVQIVPIESLDSRRQVEEGQLCVRKTARNVDLNRNWPFAWKKEDPADEQYGGSTPFSEPQSRLMKQVVDASGHRLLGYVNVHSGEWALYTPWDSKPAYGSGMPADMPELVATVGRVCDCKVGPAGSVSGYLAFGSSMDFLYVHKRVPYPLTVEVYGGGNFGKLRPGETNKRVTEFQLIERPSHDAARAPLPPRRRTLQLQQQQQTQEQQQPPPKGWSCLQLLSRLRLSSQQQQQQQRSAQGSVEAKRRRRRMQLLDAGSGMLPAPAVLASSTAAAAAAAAAGAAPSSTTAAGVVGVPLDTAGFTHSQRLPGLRQQALLQLTQQQLNQMQSSANPNVSAAAAAAVAARAGGSSAAVHGSVQQQQQQAADGILDLVFRAAQDQQACFNMFNPPNEAEYRRVVGDWLASFLLMLRHMANGEGFKSIEAAVSKHRDSRG